MHSRGIVDQGAVTYLTTQYLYDDPNLTVSAVSGCRSQNGRPFTHGFEIYLERATLTFEFANPAGLGIYQAAPVGDPARRHGGAPPCRLG